MKIFVSHRSADYESTVAPIVSALQVLLGNQNVFLDRQTLVGGAGWLSQLRAQVASSEIILCVIGPGWLTRPKTSQGEDYVTEELSIGKQLGKRIVAVTVQVSRSDLSKVIPPQISWLSRLQLRELNTDKDLAPQLRELLELGETAQERGRAAAFQAIGRLLRSVVRPLPAAGASIHPTAQNLTISLIQAGFAVIALQIGGTAMYNDNHVVFATRGILVAALLSTGIYFSIHVLATISRSEVSNYSKASYAFQFSATLLAMFSIWMTVFFLALPSHAHQDLLARFDSDLPLITAMDGYDPGLSLAQEVLLAALNWAATAHILYLLWGFTRAGALVLGWRSWMVLSVLATPALLVLGLVILALAN